MILRSTALSVATLALAATPIAAQAADVSSSRMGAELEASEGISGIPPIILIAGAVAVIVGIILIADDDDDDEEPISP